MLLKMAFIIIIKRHHFCRSHEYTSLTFPQLPHSSFRKNKIDHRPQTLCSETHHFLGPMSEHRRDKMHLVS